jgi:Fe-S cluster assembly protein SufD
MSVVQNWKTAVDQALGPQWSRDMRQKAFERFSETGLPTRKHENWRYTDLKPLSETPFIPAKIETLNQVEFYLASVPAPRLVFVNGFLSKEHSDYESVGLVAGSLREQMENQGEGLRDLLRLGQGGDSLVDLNEALAGDGAFIDVRDGVKIESPVYIVNLAIGSHTQSMVNSPRHLIRIGCEATVSLFEAYAHVGQGGYWTNASTSIWIGENANVRHYKIQNEGPEAFHVGSCYVRQERGSKYDSFTFSTGGKIGRNSLRVDLAGPEAFVTLNGIYLTRTGQHLDNFTVIDHLVPMSNSEQYYKGILSEKSRAVFNGTIIVRKNAQKTNSSQMNKNLLLGPMAEIDTRPQLKIDADDVKCSHGATIGRVNAEEMFYLESRGLSREQATNLLCLGFAEDLIYRIEDEKVRHEIENLLKETFAQMRLK